MIIDTLPDPPESYLMNCIIKGKENDCGVHAASDPPLFTMQDGVITACLNGYAIVPRDEYEAMVQKILSFENELEVAESGLAVDGDGNVFVSGASA